MGTTCTSSACGSGVVAGSLTRTTSSRDRAGAGLAGIVGLVVGRRLVVLALPLDLRVALAQVHRPHLGRHAELLAPETPRRQVEEGRGARERGARTGEFGPLQRLEAVAVHERA